MERGELAAWLRLGMTPGVGNLQARKLLAAFGPPVSIFGQDAAALAAVVGTGLAQSVQTCPDNLEALVESTWRWLGEAPDSAPRRISTLGDPDYPEALFALADPPIALYLMGRQPCTWPRSLAVVGSRNPTPQGAANGRQLASALAASGLTIVSGLALGIDGAAHEGALDGADGEALATIAVVGTGLDRVYPRRHHDLARRIAERGLLVSEYPLGTPSLAANFPRRNRLIAALGQGTLVVEAALQSGSLITARLAADLGRDVFAIPGSIHSPQSRGCHALIKQGAKLVESAQDVLEELGMPARANLAVAAATQPADAGDTVLQALGHDPASLDVLVHRTGQPTPALQARLLALELAGQVARLPGGLFQRQSGG